jgi:hypothetical protein
MRGLNHGVLVLLHPQQQYHCNTPLIDPRTMEEVGTLGITLSLNDHGPKKTEDKALLCTQSGKV